MSGTPEMRAIGLADRAEFTLLHCGQPMRWEGGRTTWTGRAPSGTENILARYVCDVCASLANIALTEVGV